MNHVFSYGQKLLHVKRLEEYETNADQLTNLGFGGVSRHATWYGLSVSNTDFGLFWDDTAVSRCDTDLRQITEKQFLNNV